MLRLKENVDEKYAIWTISHSGQEIPPDFSLPKISENQGLFNLKAQIQQKIDFISHNIDKSKQEITLIGHSIGCKMLLDIMDSEVANVKTGYLLFPTIGKMNKMRSPVLELDQKFKQLSKRLHVHQIKKLSKQNLMKLSKVNTAIKSTIFQFEFEVLKKTLQKSYKSSSVGFFITLFELY